MTVRRTLLRRIGSTGAADRGSLAMVMLVIIVGMGLAALMLPLVLVQTHTTTFDKTRSFALQAAESGIDMAVGQIRGAVDAAGAGDVSQLPCEVPSGYKDTSVDDMKNTAAVADSGIGSKYGASIAYFDSDPNSSNPPTKLDCGLGGVVGDPQFARITATGFAPGEIRDRTLEVTYTFKQPAFHKFTGQIRMYGSDLCITITGNANNASVPVQPCANTPDSKQVFEYYGNMIRLVPSDDSTDANGGWCLEIDGGSGNPLKMKGCNGDAWPKKPFLFYGQQIRFEQGDGTDWCLGKSSSGQPVTMPTCDDSSQDIAQAWEPDLAPNWDIVAAHQLMNLGSGLCMSIFNSPLDLDQLVSYGCMYLPDDKARMAPWDQTFTPTDVPGVGVKFVTSCSAGVDRNCTSDLTGCLTKSPSDNSVKVAACVDPSNQTWKQMPDYTVRLVSSGLCLEESQNTVQYGIFKYNTPYVNTCNDSPFQKWNVPASERDDLEQHYENANVLSNLYEK
jgi:hypothetical protein